MNRKYVKILPALLLLGALFALAGAPAGAKWSLAEHRRRARRA